MLPWQRPWKKRKRGEDVTVRLRPDPVLREITFDLAERGMALCGVDIDDFLRGEAGPARPPLRQLPEFFALILENADKFEPERWPIHLREKAAEIVVAAFFLACTESWIGPLPTSAAPA